LTARRWVPEAELFMNFNSILAFAAAFTSVGVAGFVLVRDRHSYIHRVFVVGAVALAVDQAFLGMSLSAAVPTDLYDWQRLRFLAMAFALPVWIFFSAIFARADYREFVAKWKWAFLAVLVVSLSLPTLFRDDLMYAEPDLDFVAHVIRLGWSGYGFYLMSLVCAVGILMNLERALRASTGSIRWRIKFMVLGIGALFAVRVYTASQALLFSAIDLDLNSVNSAALIVASLLIVIALTRTQLLHVDLYFSPALLYNSITVLVVGIYLIAVGIVAKLVSYVGGETALSLNAFLVFLALLALTVFMLSDELRQNVKKLIYRHMQRPRHDYRKQWLTFTERTTSLMDMKLLCAAIAKIVAETFGVSSVSVWLLDDARERLILGGSTFFTEAQARDLKSAEQGAPLLIDSMRGQVNPVDFKSFSSWAREPNRAQAEYISEARVRYCASLNVGPEWLGVVTLNDRVNKEPFSVEDFDLLKTLVDQAAGAMLTLKLSERLARAKEMEAFQNLSAFFTHDLKNLASTLGLTLQNLSAHFDDPEFRKDAERAISRSVEKIDSLCGRLSVVSKKLELCPIETDLNELIASTVGHLNGSVRVPLVQQLHPIGQVVVDPDQMKKVLLNLILNAAEAVGSDGRIEIATETRRGWTVMSVRDNGCGMSREFILQHLFLPLRTTKEHGLGIGLFQCKKIIEAHRGKIEVESEVGQGSAFHVMLPAQP
jgi:putative PEP-CTERM system histidine kinase